MDNTQDSNPGIARSIPCFSGSDETLNRGPVLYDLAVGGTLNPSSLTHCISKSFQGVILFLGKRGRDQTTPVPC